MLNSQEIISLHITYEKEENLDKGTSIQNGLDRAGKYESCLFLLCTVSLSGCFTAFHIVEKKVG